MPSSFGDEVIKHLLPLDVRYAVGLHRVLVDVMKDRSSQTWGLDIKYKLHQQLLTHAMEMAKELFQGVYVLTGVRDG